MRVFSDTYNNLAQKDQNERELIEKVKSMAKYYNNAIYLAFYILFRMI